MTLVERVGGEPPLVIDQGERVLIPMHWRGKRIVIGPHTLPQLTKHLELTHDDAHRLLLQLAQVVAHPKT